MKGLSPQAAVWLLASNQAPSLPSQGLRGHIENVQVARAGTGARTSLLTLHTVLSGSVMDFTH